MMLGLTRVKYNDGVIHRLLSQCKKGTIPSNITSVVWEGVLRLSAIRGLVLWCIVLRDEGIRIMVLSLGIERV